MVEIAICLGVIGFALVAIIGILPMGMSVQKDNREETIINFDGAFLMNAIRSGAQGQDDLTNYIINISNYWTVYDLNTNPVTTGINWFTTTNCSVNGATFNTFALTNGSNIVGLLSTPKYLWLSPTSFRSNYVTADFRAITGDALDQGTNLASQDFAFKYRLYPEIIPYGVVDPSFTNYTAAGLPPNDILARSNFMVTAMNLQANLSDVRLRFRWPILPNSQVANGRQIFRGTTGGQMAQAPAVKGLVLYYVQPQNYIQGTTLGP